jgi:hypothetical protein
MLINRDKRNGVDKFGFARKAVNTIIRKLKTTHIQRIIINGNERKKGN